MFPGASLFCAPPRVLASLLAGVALADWGRHHPDIHQAKVCVCGAADPYGGVASACGLLVEIRDSMERNVAFVESPGTIPTTGKAVT